MYEKYIPFIHYSRTWLYDNIYSNPMERNEILNKMIESDHFNYNGIVFNDAPLSMLCYVKNIPERHLSNESITSIAAMNFEHILFDIIQRSDIESTLQGIMDTYGIKGDAEEFKEAVSSNICLLYLGTTRVFKVPNGNDFFSINL